MWYVCETENIQAGVGTSMLSGEKISFTSPPFRRPNSCPAEPRNLPTTLWLTLLNQSGRHCEAGKKTKIKKNDTTPETARHHRRRRKQRQPEPVIIQAGLSSGGGAIRQGLRIVDFPNPRTPRPSCVSASGQSTGHFNGLHERVEACRWLAAAVKSCCSPGGSRCA